MEVHRYLQTTVRPTLVVNVSLGYPEEVFPGQETTFLLRGLIDADAEPLVVQ